MEVCRKSSWLFLLLGLLCLAASLQGVQGGVESEGPSESECRPYIEKALKELEAAEAIDPIAPGDTDGDSREDIPTVEITTDDSDHEVSDGDNDDEGTDSTESAETEHEEETGDSKEKADADDVQSAEQADEANSSEVEKTQSEEEDANPEESDAESQEDDKQSGEEKSVEAGDEQESTEHVKISAKESAESAEDGIESAKGSQDVTADKAESAEDAESAENKESTEDQKSAEDKESVEDKESAEDTETKKSGEDDESVENTDTQSAENKGSAEDGNDDDDSKQDVADDKSDESVENATDGGSKEDEKDSKEVVADTKEDDGDSKESDGGSKEDGGASKEVDDDSKEDAKESVEVAKDSGEDETKEDTADSKETVVDVKLDEQNSKEEAAAVESKEDSKEDQAEADKDSKEENKADSKEENVEDEKDVKKDEIKGDTKEEEDGGSNEEENEDSAPEEELIIEGEIPEELRSTDHISQLLKLDEENLETQKIIDKVADVVLKELKKLYENAIKPLEVLYKYRDLSNRHFGDAEIFSKPLVVFMGPWSGGKSSIINYLVENEYNATALKTGAEPSPAYFNILMYGDEPEVLDGTQLAADFTFSGLQKFGQGLEERLRGLKLPKKLLEKINIVEIPGILEVRKQISRVFPFNDACQWFIDRADIIFLVYDPSKLDVGPETEAILDQLKGREHQTRIILNKADQVKPEELMRVQGALIWNISPLMSSAQPPIMYTTSLWSRPYEPWAPVRLLQAQERAFLRDLRSSVDKRIENKISSARRFAVRVRNHAKMVDCYLTTYYNHKSVFGNRKLVSDAIIEHPQDYHIYEGLSTLTNISRYDLPDPDVYRDFFRLNPLYDFQQLSATCTYFRGCPINRLDVAIAYDLPELVGKYKRMVESAIAEGNQAQTPGS